MLETQHQIESIQVESDNAYPFQIFIFKSDRQQMKYSMIFTKQKLS